MIGGSAPYLSIKNNITPVVAPELTARPNNLGIQYVDAAFHPGTGRHATLNSVTRALTWVP
jgi:hypothetical protein